MWGENGRALVVMEEVTSWGQSQRGKGVMQEDLTTQREKKRSRYRAR